MTKAELVEGVSKMVRQPKRTVERVLDSAFDQIARSIKKDKRFSVPDFGTFSIRRRRSIGAIVERAPDAGLPAVQDEKISR